jgi:6-hydroxycyclohex-1-ene-1-carbonyl-CoA dehydrogenase
VPHPSGYFLDAPRRPLVERELDLPDPGPGEVVVEVTACGLCHTDLGFADGSVAPRHPLPLVLGHEIVGRVAAAGTGCDDLVGRPVLVPAVLPCGDCDLCRAGRGNACLAQTMPGNDVHGGFATHLVVPAAPLVDLRAAPPALRLDELAVVADAVSTAFQAVRRSGLEAGDAAVVVGGGGVGGFVAQIARAHGALVAVLDVDPARLAAAEGFADATFAAGGDDRQVRRDVQRWLAGRQVPAPAWRIFECSGSPAGQVLAFGLLGRAATLVQVGYTREKVELRLSNLMAHDATVHGTWGCPPEAYPEVLELIYDGRVDLAPVVDHAPMSRLNGLLDDMAHHRLERRMILHPEH